MCATPGRTLTAEPSARSQAPRWAAIDTGLVALLALPFVVGVVAMLTGRYSHFTFVGDDANNQLLISDVGHYAVLIGPYAREGWNHLGPLMYYLLAGPFRLFGSRSAGVVAGALLIGGASVIGTVLYARALGGRLLMALVAAAQLTLLLALGTAFLRDPWNPRLPVLPFGLFLFASWALADGRRWALPVVAGVGTFCVQTHVGYLPLVAALAAAALVLGALDGGRNEPSARGAWLAPLAVTAGVFVLTWLPPLVDQVARTGNLGRAVQHLTSGGQRGFAPAARIVGDAFSIRPGWITGVHTLNEFNGEPNAALHGSFPWLGLALVVAFAVTWRRESRTTRIGAGLCVLAVAISIAGLARTPGLVFDYRLRFLWVIAATATAVAVWMLVRFVARVAPSTRRVAVVLPVLGVLLLVALGALATAAQTSPDPPDADLATRTDTIVRQMNTVLPRGSGPYEMVGATYPALTYLPAIRVRLEDAHRTVRDAPSRIAELTVGRHRLLSGRRAGVITVFLGPDADLSPAPGSRLIAQWVREPAAARARDRAEALRLDRDHPVASRTLRTWHRIERLRARANVFVVFLAS